ncbi:MAG: YiiX/YebB-like N1pC/P60 family cysteine hydrolase, partial [Bacteroidales bacterium]|nr:YiiX/YebB-like N1pC/P60 family cysteine hydrolase [Bacteroidales bacterium]
MRLYFALIFLLIVSDVRTSAFLEKTLLKDVTNEQLHNHQQAAAFLWETILRINQYFSEIQKNGLHEIQIHDADADKKSQLKTYLIKLHQQHEILKIYIGEYGFSESLFPGEERTNNPETFILGYAADMAQYDLLLRMARLSSNNEYFKSIFREVTQQVAPEENYGLLMAEAALPAKYFRLYSGNIDLEELLQSTVLSEPMQKLAEYSLSTHGMTGASTVVPFAMAATGLQDYVSSSTSEAFYSFQVKVSDFASNLRFSLRKGYYITTDQLSTLYSLLEPGDILLQRREGYLSNIGIPGFYTHSAIYTGDFELLDRYFSEESQQRWRYTFSEFVEKQYPEIFTDMMIKNPQGFFPTTIEAKGVGIIVLPLEVSGNADHLAALRPRLTKDEKLQAILFAFDNYGKPYDYDFDLKTDLRLGCSELIYKAYLPTKGKNGLTYTLQEVAGRWMLTPNDIARDFATN